MTPAGKMKIPNPYCTSTRHAQSYPRVPIVYFWKCRCSSSDKLYRKQEKSFFDPHLTPRGKMKIPKPYCASTGHGQSSLRISLVFFLKCWWSLNDKTTLQNVIFRPLFDPRGQNKILKPYCASTRHTQWDHRVSFLKSLKCRRSSSFL